MHRMRWLEKEFGEKLRGRLASDGGFLGVAVDAVRLMATFDPAANKRFTSWLIRTYLDGGFRRKDLYRAKTNLELFEKSQRFLKSEMRDISRYKTLSHLWLAVKPFAADDTPVTGKEERRRQKAEAYDHSIIKPAWLSDRVFVGRLKAAALQKEASLSYAA